MIPSDVVYLRHILDAILRIKEYLQGINEEEFNSNYLVQDGVIRQLEIVGEAAKHISQKIRRDHGYVPWKDMAGMRDKLIHNYFGLDVEQVWLTAKNDIPFLQTKIEKVLDRLES
ncbi:DUF86 domain-containing protein [candidate division KSB1 bacterium]|nr:DUF86 domain-containing protein [candidate division KSB1 bacterium]